MPINQPFRTAFRGFDREDVVRYIEYLNNHYTKQLEDLTGQTAAEAAASLKSATLNGCFIGEAETVTAKKYWPFPTYGDLLFSVN